jgi:hypothetical protein
VGPIDVGVPGGMMTPTTPAAGAGGTSATPVPLPGMDPGIVPPTPMAGTAATPVDPMMGTEGCALALDECGVDSGWPGDEFCILPPPPDMGFQVHVGPSNYANPEPQYVLQPGQETDEHFPAVSGNDKDIFYYWRQYRMRAGSHHLILSTAGGGGFGVQRRLGGSSIAAKDNPECGIIAPENEGVGMPLGPKTALDVNLHYFNVGGTGPVLQETWVNFWYRDPAVVKEQTKEMFSMGGLAMAIQPGEHTTLGRYSCPILTPGRVMTMYGHYHANTVRFSAWRVRGGASELILEDYDWHEPLALEYSSIVTNTPPDAAAKVPGGHNGPLDLQAGDALAWECEVNNTTSGVLRFTNEAVSGEMCILVGDTIGPTVSCQFP